MIVFAIVMFNRDISTLPTLLSLKNALRKVGHIEHRILILDNSDVPNPTAAENASECIYVPFGNNVGISKAYNHALLFCIENRAVALVTLDQDSTITSKYLDALMAGVRDLNDSVVALCPKVRLNSRALSPWTFNVLGVPRFWPSNGRLFAINSFSAYSVDFLRLIGGFDEYYWLDGLDFSTYARIHRAGKQVKLLEAVVQHDLSLLSGSVSRSRLFNINYYEASFLVEYCDTLHIASGLLRLILRSHRLAEPGLKGKYLTKAISACINGALAGLRRRNRRPPSYVT